METPRCPGQDLSRWTPEDISGVPCPSCGAEVEIWKDEPFRPCHECGQRVANPRLDPGCAAWCRYAAECLEKPERT